MNTIRWGMIGCGDVTEIKSGPAFQKANGSELVAVMRRTGHLAEDYARRHNVPKWFDNAEELIHNPDVDAVYVATPPGSHLEYVLKVCEAGKPVYVEKPMARNYEECRRMIASFRKNKLSLFVAFYRRGLPRFIKVKEIVESGKLGKISIVQYHFSGPYHKKTDPDNLPWRLKAEQSGGGLFMDLGCHALDILDFIFGPINHVSGIAENIASPYEVEDVVVMNYNFLSGIVGTASWNFASDMNKDLIEIIGSDGGLSLSVFGNEPLQLKSGEKVEEYELPNPAHIQQPLIQTIVDELLGRGTCPSTGESASRTAYVMDVVLKDYYGSRSDDFWNRPDTWHGIK